MATAAATTKKTTPNNACGVHMPMFGFALAFYLKPKSQPNTFLLTSTAAVQNKTEEIEPRKNRKTHAVAG